MKHDDSNDWLPGMLPDTVPTKGMANDYNQSPCINTGDGELVFASRSTLTEEEKERADLHIGSCLACQTEMDFDFFFIRMLESVWDTYNAA